MVNRALSEVKVIEPGGGYTEEDTVITILDAGENDIDAVFTSKLKTWNVNLFQKNFPYFDADDGVIVSGTNELQYSHLYAPRVFRETNYAIDSEGNIQYGLSLIHI